MIRRNLRSKSGGHFWRENIGAAGTTRQMKQLLLDHAFKFVENVVFYVGENNIRSQKATEKIGAIKRRYGEEEFMEIVRPL